MKSNLFKSFLANLLYFLIEITGFFLSNSFALLSDAFHDLGDCIAIGIAAFLDKKAQKNPDHDHPLGHERLRLLGALFTSSILIISSVSIMIGALKRLQNPNVVYSQIMIVVSILGLIINGINAYSLSRGNKNVLEKSIMLHLFEDMFGNMALLVASTVIYFTKFYYIDSIFSIMISGFIFYNAMKNLYNVVQEIILASPKNIDYEKLEKTLEQFDNVINFTTIIYSGDENIIFIQLTNKDNFLEIKKSLSDYNFREIYFDVC